MMKADTKTRVGLVCVRMVSYSYGELMVSYSYGELMVSYSYGELMVS